MARRLGATATVYRAPVPGLSRTAASGESDFYKAALDSQRLFQKTKAGAARF